AWPPIGPAVGAQTAQLSLPRAPASAAIARSRGDPRSRNGRLPRPPVNSGGQKWCCLHRSIQRLRYSGASSFAWAFGKHTESVRIWTARPTKSTILTHPISVGRASAVGLHFAAASVASGTLRLARAQWRAVDITRAI